MVTLHLIYKSFNRQEFIGEEIHLFKQCLTLFRVKVLPIGVYLQVMKILKIVNEFSL